MSTPTEHKAPEALVRQAQQTASDIFAGVNRAMKFNGAGFTFNENARAKTVAGLLVVFQAIREAGRKEGYADAKVTGLVGMEVLRHTGNKLVAMCDQQEVEIARLKERNNCSACEDRTAELGRAKRERDELLAEHDSLKEQLAAAESALAQYKQAAEETWGATCIHHTTAERVEAGCPVCNKSALTAEQAKREQMRAALDLCLPHVPCGSAPCGHCAALKALALTRTDALRTRLLEVEENAFRAGMKASANKCGDPDSPLPLTEQLWQEYRRTVEEGK